MKRIILIFFVIGCILNMYAQRVTNVRAEQKQDKIIITYDLSGKADISLNMEVDGKRRPITRLTGDIGKNIVKGQDKMIAWDVLDEYIDGFDEDNVVFTVKASPAWRTFALFEGALSPAPLQGSGGFLIGRAARWGYYLKFRSSFMFAPSNDGVFSQSWVEMGGNRTYYKETDINKLITGNKKNTELICDAGALYNFSMNPDYPMYVYLGLGYGMRRQMWEFTNNKWLRYTPTSYEGVSVDLGLMFSIKNFLLEVGVNTINFQYAEIQLGVGWLFNK